MWKILQGALPIGENLRKRGMLLNNVCCRCEEIETADHLFLHCQFAKDVWASSLLQQNPNVHEFLSFKEALISLHGVVSLPPLGVSIDLFPWICWGIWLARNKVVFENRASSPSEFFSQSIRYAREWQNAQPHQDHHHPSTNLRDHTRVGHDTILCYSDAAWKHGSPTAGCGWSFQSPQGHILLNGSCTHLHVKSPLQAEALAVREAILNAKSLGYSKICLKSDCQGLLAAINSKFPPAEIFGIIRDIESLSILFTACSFVFVSRSANSLADSLAKSALSNGFVRN
ncbi:hypothetical protein DY000_02059984 [Brassica cretica]|uniref:RNase H type-1 domain-containing protein n=1 Tax=Brassica cretica TaxID=69181 RepID=A0ABQ7B0T9_BRACR|nr:hypothetical protein DY000_02059984 [Brassica cretica]